MEKFRTAVFHLFNQRRILSSRITRPILNSGELTAQGMESIPHANSELDSVFLILSKGK